MIQPHYRAIRLVLGLIAILALFSFGLPASWEEGVDFGIKVCLAFLVGVVLLAGRPLQRIRKRSRWFYALILLASYLTLSYYFSPARELTLDALGFILAPLLVYFAAAVLPVNPARILMVLLAGAGLFLFLAAIGVAEPRPEQLFLYCLILPFLTAAIFSPGWSYKLLTGVGFFALVFIFSRDCSGLLPGAISFGGGELLLRPFMGFSPGLSAALGEAGYSYPELLSMVGFGRLLVEMGLLGTFSFTLVIYLTIRDGFSGVKVSGSRRGLRFGLFLGTVFFFVVAMLTPVRPGLAGWLLFYLVLGVLTALGHSRVPASSSVRARQKNRLPFWLARPQGASSDQMFRSAGQAMAVFFCVALFFLSEGRREVARYYLQDAGTVRAERELRLLRRGAACHSGVSELNLRLAAALARAADYTTAISLYKAECGAKPLAARAHDGLGELYSRRGQLSMAYWEVYRALVIDNGLANAYLNMGDIFSSKGGFARALGYYRLGLERDPGNPRLHFAVAESLYNTRRLEAAISSYRKAGSLDPDITKVDYKIGLCNFYLGRGEEAAAALRRYLRHAPGDKKARLLLGRCDY